MGRSFPVLLVALAFVVPLAGCLTSDPDGGVPPPSPEAGGSGGSAPPAGTPQGSMTKEDALRAFEAAASRLDAGEGFDRLGMHLRVDAVDAEKPTYVEGSLLFDREKALAVMQLTAEGVGDEDGGSAFAKPGQAFVTGAVWKTAFFGGGKELVAIYNESANPPESWSDFAAGGPASEGGGGMDASELKRFLASPDVDGVQSVEPTMYEGRSAVKIVFRAEEKGTSLDGEAIVFATDPPRLALVSGTIRDPSAEEAYERHGKFRMTFAYGADATHPMERALERAEALAFKGEGDPMAFGGAPSLNFTFVPSRAATKIPLAEVEARVYEASPGMQSPDTPPLLTLALEAGSAENADVRIVFTDADGNGRVSPGDTLRLQPKRSDGEDAGSYVVRVFDRETGVLLTPAPGLLAVFGALAAVVVASRRRA